MRIGTDMSLKTCFEEGYTVMDFAVRKLYPKGRKNGIDKDCRATFSASYPAYIRKNIGSEGNPFGNKPAWKTDASFNDLLEIYKLNPGVDRFCGLKPGSRETENPTEYDMLDLADELAAYCGIE